MTEESLNNILNDDEPTPEQAHAEEAEELSHSKATTQALREDEASDGPVRDDKGRFAPKGEKQPEEPAAEAPPAPQDQSEHIPIAALKDERNKRQALEAEIAQMKAYLENLQKPQPEPAPDMWDNTEGWQQHFGQTVTTTATQYATEQARLHASEMLVAQAHEDFDEVRPKILEMIGQNPALQQQVLTDRHPWAKAYQLVKNHERMQSLGAVDVDDLKAKLREELKAELLKEAPAKLSSAPPSISADRSVGGRNPPQFSGPTPLTDII